MSETTETCKWIRDELDEYFDTQCEQSFFFDSGTIEENNFSFCPYCGKKIEEVKG